RGCWRGGRTASGGRGRWRFLPFCRSTAPPRRSGLRRLGRHCADVQAAALFEIALGRVERLLARIQGLLEPLELLLPGVERLLPSFDRSLEVRRLRFTSGHEPLGHSQQRSAL